MDSSLLAGGKIMSTGYDEEGMKDSLICVEPPDGDGAGDEVQEDAVGGAEVPVEGSEALANWNPNVIAWSQSRVEDNAGAIIDYGDIGLNDWSLEFWILYCSMIQDWRNAGIGTDGMFITGDPVGPGYRDTGVGFLGTGISIQFDHITTGLVQATAAGLLPYNWSHVVGNFDRDADMTLFVNGRAVANADISLAAAVNHIGDNLRYGSGSVDVGGTISDVPGWGGPFALHYRLLTAAEIRDAYLQKTVNNLGAATTVGRYDFRDIVRTKANVAAGGAGAGNYGWQNIRELGTPYDHGGGFADGDMGPYYAPYPAYLCNNANAGTYTLVDSSGNGRDIALWWGAFPAYWSYSTFWK